MSLRPQSLVPTSLRPYVPKSLSPIPLLRQPLQRLPSLRHHAVHNLASHRTGHPRHRGQGDRPAPLAQLKVENRRPAYPHPLRNLLHGNVQCVAYCPQQIARAVLPRPCNPKWPHLLVQPLPRKFSLLLPHRVPSLILNLARSGELICKSSAFPPGTALNPSPHNLSAGTTLNPYLYVCASPAPTLEFLRAQPGNACESRAAYLSRRKFCAKFLLFSTYPRINTAQSLIPDLRSLTPDLCPLL